MTNQLEHNPDSSRAIGELVGLSTAFFPGSHANGVRLLLSVDLKTRAVH